jgi:hypothetical protein
MPQFGGHAGAGFVIRQWDPGQEAAMVVQKVALPLGSRTDSLLAEYLALSGRSLGRKPGLYHPPPVIPHVFLCLPRTENLDYITLHGRFLGMVWQTLLNPSSFHSQLLPGPPHILLMPRAAMGMRGQSPVNHLLILSTHFPPTLLLPAQPLRHANSAQTPQKHPATPPLSSPSHLLPAPSHLFPIPSHPLSLPSPSPPNFSIFFFLFFRGRAGCAGAGGLGGGGRRAAAGTSRGRPQHTRAVQQARVPPAHGPARSRG